MENERIRGNLSMGEEFENEEMVTAAMQIIMNAGDARPKVKDALKLGKAFDFENAGAKMEEARKCIAQAHHAQTDIIQSEAGGKKYEFSLLFAHAQDTLMTIMSEIQMADEMLDILKIISEK